jgi:hypothetical protein
MADSATIASIATAGGTLILAVATFSSTRSANHAARVAERSLLVGLRPVLMPSRETDPPERVGFGDEVSFTLSGGRAVAQEVDGRMYLAMSLRNVGAGLGVLHGWAVQPGRPAMSQRAQLDDFRRQQRDLYIAAGDSGFWQGAVRDPDDPVYAGLRQALAERAALTVDVLYGDHEGGQRTITRFGLIPREDPAEGHDFLVARHWHLDSPEPR